MLLISHGHMPIEVIDRWIDCSSVKQDPETIFQILKFETTKNKLDYPVIRSIFHKYRKFIFKSTFRHKTKKNCSKIIFEEKPWNYG